MEQTNRIHKIEDSIARQLHACELYNCYVDIVQILLKWIITTDPSCVRITINDEEIKAQFNKAGFEESDLKEVFAGNEQIDIEQLVRWRMLPYLKQVCQLNIFTNSPEGKSYKYDVNANRIIYNALDVTKSFSQIIIKEVFSNFPVRQKVLQISKEQKEIQTYMTQVSIIYPQIKFILSSNEDVLVESLSQMKQDRTFVQTIINSICYLYTSLTKSDFQISIEDDLFFMTLKNDTKIVKPRCWLLAVNNEIFDMPPEIEKVLKKYSQTKMVALLILKLDEKKFEGYKRQIWIYEIQRFEEHLAGLLQKLLSKKIVPSSIEQYFPDRQITRKRVGRTKTQLSIYNEVDNEATRIKNEFFYEAKYNRIQKKLDKKEQLMKEAEVVVKQTQQKASQEEFETQLIGYSEKNSVSVNYREISDMQCIGQFAKGFVISQLGDSLYIVDQHAASQKILYQKYLTEPQQICQNVFLAKLSKQYLMTVQQQDIKLRLLGWEFTIQQILDEAFTIKFTKTPQKCGYKYQITQFIETIDHLSSKTQIQNQNVKKIIALKACNESFRVGDELNQAKMKSVLEALAQLSSPYNCPHGRPTIFQIGKAKEFCNKIKSSKNYSL